MNRLAAAISQAARAHGSRTALIERERTLSFAQTEALANRIASGLIRLGVGKGERVGIYLPNCIEYVCIDLALIKAGLVRVPINPRLMPSEVDHLLRDSGASVLFHGPEQSEAVAQIKEGLPDLQHRFCLGDPFEALTETGSEAPIAVPVTDDDPYMILYTSGTTGKPKGAVTDLRSRWVTLFHVYANELFVRESDVMLHLASLGHGSGTKVLPFFLKGAANLLMPKFDPQTLCELVQRWRVTATWMVPTTITMLLNFKERSRYDLSSLHTITYAGAPIAPERLKQALEAFGPIFLQVYGLSEAPQPDLVLRKEDHLAMDARLGSAGRPALGVEVRVVRSDGTEVSPGSGEIGEILLAGEHLMTGYWGRPEATAEVLKEGWLHTGDLAKVDEEGYIYIVDRVKELIISGGYNVYPREVEELLLRHPAVEEAAVFGIPDPKWGEAVHAVVALREGAPKVTSAELIAYCRDRMANYKCPKSLEITAGLPKGPTGKILKRPMRESYWRNEARQVH